MPHFIQSVKFTAALLLMLGGMGQAVADAPTAEGAQVKDMNLKARYDVYWRGFRVFSSEVAAIVEDGDYETTANFYVRGMAKLFTSGRSDVRAVGSVAPDGRVIPSHWLVTGKWEGDTTYRHVTFDASGRVKQMKIDIPDKWEEYPLAPIPDDLQRGPDPMSMLVAALRQPWLRQDMSKPYQLSIIDGRGVTELSLDCADAPEKLELKDSRTDVKGDAIPCFVSQKRLAGFVDEAKLDDKQRKKLEKEREKGRKRAEKAAKRRAKDKAKGKQVEEEGQIKVWFQYQKSSHAWLPVYAEMDKVKIYLAMLETDLEVKINRDINLDENTAGN